SGPRSGRGGHPHHGSSQKKAPAVATWGSIRGGVAQMNLDRMFEMQGYLDRRIRYSRRLMGENLISKKVLALQVEIAELAQEVGDAWKYWKTPRPRNRERVLEELVDVLHFLLSIGLDIGIDPNERPIYA